MDYISEPAGSNGINRRDQETLKLNRQSDVPRDANTSLQKSSRKATNLSLPLEGSSEAEDQLAASFIIDNDAVEFANADIKISR